MIATLPTKCSKAKQNIRVNHNQANQDYLFQTYPIFFNENFKAVKLFYPQQRESHKKKDKTSD